MMKEERKLKRLRKFRELREQMINFADYYFKDMKLEIKRYRKKFCESKIKTGRKWETVENSTIADSFDLSLFEWEIRYSKKLDDCDGNCNVRGKIILIKHGITGEELKETILHEMIHAYIGILPAKLKEFMLLDFYKILTKKIGKNKLASLIEFDTHEVFSVDVHSHTLLFLFKSLLLDLRLHKPLGTIYSYGREKHFK